MLEDVPRDPFADDPDDPAAALGDSDAPEPLTPAERDEAVTDLADVEVFRSLLEPQGVFGLVLDCPECGDQHYFNWELLRGNLRQMIDNGKPQVHEPAYEPNPTDYVSWDYAQGYADGVIDTEERR
ncbi:DUF5319 family protein [Planomonospora sp. ID91781]|uniref:DUF5319 domain-containing protein n=3 Tax=Planomonospora TaxID=1998 RepID=A0A161MA69_9ACTN|nr:MULTISPECIES: DUF5319 family protein [Planomonospora]MBG0820723.1 DUF5319 family protein [Planomonospora sp. ID91781]GAT66463.1 hypothetical protein PS9374_02113 [Planomonospora sphaerica]GGK55536.1 hypothetical protein GCM10010126_13830 [Planomonospora parontospora]GII07377.1 hypothetical protein Ppa06_11750 [Planomonospora parontospora subsp. parontospora]